MRLETEHALVEIDPKRGGRIASLRIHGHELLVPEGSDPLRWGCYPMAPWAGRIRNGEFSFEGHQVQLPLGMPPHAIHGTVHERAWEERDDGSLRTELGEDWPFGGEARASFELLDDRLVWTLSVHATDAAFPASIGWHPWFRRNLDVGAPAELHFEARQMYLRDSSGIPTGERTAPTVGPWDDCFTELVRGPEIHWPRALRLKLESSADHWVVYDEAPHAICVEPQTGPPDAVRLAPRIVRPDRPIRATVTLRWKPSED